MIGMIEGQGHLVEINRSNPLHLDAQGRMGADAPERTLFQSMVFDSLAAVNEDQQRSAQLYEQMILDPDSVDVHDVTIAAAEANMSLNMAKTILNRAVEAYKGIINMR